MCLGTRSYSETGTVPDIQAGYVHTIYRSVEAMKHTFHIMSDFGRHIV